MKKIQSCFDSKEQLEKYKRETKDARDWYKAYELLKLKRSEINDYLKTLSSEDEIDMRRRLNTVIENRKKKALLAQEKID